MKYKSLIQKNNLKPIRLSNDLTQTEVAHLLGFTTNERISKWESGSKLPSLANLFLLAIIYNTNPIELYPDLYEYLLWVIQEKCPPRV